VLFLFSYKLDAAPRCNLDTSNPALTRTVIPLHTPSQGVTQYADPSEWPAFTFQEHWRQIAGQGMPHDPFISEAGIILLMDDVMHLHAVEVCFPHGGEWPQGMTSLTLPVRQRAFMEQGSNFGIFGEMVRSMVWDPTSQFTGDPLGVTVATGHFTLDVALAQWGGNNNVLRPALNGWTNFHACGSSTLTDGSFLNDCASLAMYTRFVPELPEETDFLSSLMSRAEASSQRDPGGSVWGALLVEFTNRVLPVLAPFSTVQDLRTPGFELCRAYAGDGTIMASKVCEMRVGMDLHAHNVGRHLNSPFGVLDPAEISLGVPGSYPITFLAQTTTGPNGIPGVAGPNEMVTSIVGFTVEIGDSGPPPTPVDCVVGPWYVLSSLTTTSAVTTIGLHQQKTDTTNVVYQRDILTAPSGGGAACPVN
jgi:hypothetical protein